MELSELTAYANEKYQIKELHKWADFPGFSVLCHPQSGKWVALLMRQWDGETGEVLERCDLKCGGDMLLRYRRPYLSGPARMHGKNWIGIVFDQRTEKDVVFRLFDQAIAADSRSGYTIVLGSQFLPAEGSGNTPGAVYSGPVGNNVSTPGAVYSDPVEGNGNISGVVYSAPGGGEYGNITISPRGMGGYQDTPLPDPGRVYPPAREVIPERIRQMRHLYEYGRESAEARAKNFYRQAVFMQDYEDDYPWSGDFKRYFPTYYDLSARQLRGYFTWRTHLRRGEFQPIAASVAYIYLYELLNGVGAEGPEDTLNKMREFEKGFLDSGIGEEPMRAHLHRWMMEFAIVRGLPVEMARQAADPEMLERDRALAVLRSSEEYTEEEVFGALAWFGGKKLEGSPVLTKDPERGKRLFCEAWRAASAYHLQDKDLFTLCFGERKRRPWHPFYNAVYYEAEKTEAKDYALDDCRSFHYRNGEWQVEAFDKMSFDRTRWQSFLHETDARLRRYLKTGRYLRENPADEWLIPYIDAVIEAEKQALIEAARPKITIDLSGLEQIRRDAVITQESLLTEEDLAERDEVQESEDTGAAGLPLDSMEVSELGEVASNRVEPLREPGYTGVAGLSPDSMEVGKPEDTIAAGLWLGSVQMPESGEVASNRVEPLREPGGREIISDLLVQNHGEMTNPELARKPEDTIAADLPLDPVQVQILRILLEGGDVSEIIQAHHWMPSIVADSINDALFDEIGDTVLLCEEDRLLLVEDYIEDVRDLLG